MRDLNLNSMLHAVNEMNRGCNGLLATDNGRLAQRICYEYLSALVGATDQ